jgi:hypothetical protein
MNIRYSYPFPLPESYKLDSFVQSYFFVLSPNTDRVELYPWTSQFEQAVSIRFPWLTSLAVLIRKKLRIQH